MIITQKILIKILVLIVCLISVDYISTSALDYLYFKNAQFGPKTVYSIEKAEADIIVFGSSSASHHYDPKILEDSLGLSCYNAGLDGRNIYYHTAVLKVMLKRFQPSVIIFDISSLDFSVNKKNDDFKGIGILNPFYSKYKPELKDILYLQGPYEKYKLFSGIYRYNSKLDDVLLSTFRAGPRVSKLKGFDPLYGSIKDSVSYREFNNSSQKDSFKIEYLRNFIELAQSRGCKVFFFRSPVFHKYDREIDYSFLTDSLSADGFWSFQTDTTFVSKNKYFKDGTHLNHEGAVKYSEIVSSLIKSKLK